MTVRTSYSAHAYKALALCAFVALPAGPTLAQSSTTSSTGNLIAFVTRVGNKPVPSPRSVPPALNAAACSEGTITVRVIGLPDADEYPRLETWLATGAGQCEQADRDSRANEHANCTRLSSHARRANDTNGRSATIKVPIDSLCDHDGEFVLYFLALPREKSDADQKAQYYKSLTLSVDTNAPEAATDLEVNDDDNGLNLSWSAPDTAARYAVLVDTTAERDDAGACSSKFLEDQGSISAPDFKDLPEGVFVKEINAQRSYTLDPEELGDSDTAAAGVIVFDRAGNASPISNIVCLCSEAQKDD